MKGKAHSGDFQVQDVVKKKKKKKRKPNESNNNHENAETVEDAEPGHTSPVLFEDPAAQGREKKKKLKRKAEKQQTLLDNYFVKVERGVSNGTAAAASPRKKKRRKGEDSSHELSCVPVSQEGAAACGYSKTHKKKRKEKQQPEEDEVGELPPPEEHKGHKEKAKKKRKKRREGTAEPLLPPSEQDRGWISPAAEDGACDAASGTSEVSLELPAGFSTPSKAAGRAAKAPKSSAYVVEESSSDSDVMTPKALGSREEQQNNSFAELAASDEVSVDGDFNSSAMTSVVDLDTARQQLEEFIPHVKNISDSSIKKMAGRDLTRFKEFKKQGMAVKFGRFTQKENKQIRKNVEEFLALTGIDCAEKLLFTSRYPEDKHTIQRLKTEHHFCEKISEGIPRPWRLIYYRARKMFDPNNYKGRYTAEEKEKLKKYQALHGNDWKKISELMSRSNLSVAMKFSEIKSAINYGPWTEEETRKLMSAVKDVMWRKLRTENPSSLSSLEESSTDLWIDREQLHQPLPWTEIETKVGSRYWRQCKQKWNSILTNKLTRVPRLHRGTNGLRTKITLIKRLYETKAEDASEVNWDELSNAMGDVPRVYVQSKFYRLKVSFVPLWKRRTFSEIIDYLYENALPELEEKLREEEGKHSTSVTSTARQQQKAFRFSDIFDSNDEILNDIFDSSDESD
ncbi:transcription termination factor 1 [Passer montanus]|uniref:transcription termination factor 1 n=1 Tax=Passer montanus TaxID=9160 RepID=UPI00195F2D86|nr:transcription termination factor 1 [Passer montanus]XP_039576106.1 transcription termination factor 1 [Passer montanus]XP_039576107.1 transcription termination factor 1 [Passer montanus]